MAPKRQGEGLRPRRLCASPTAPVTHARHCFSPKEIQTLTHTQKNAARRDPSLPPRKTKTPPPRKTHKLKTIRQQYSVKHEQDLDCGGGYIKLAPGSSKSKMKEFGGDTPYSM